MTDTTQEENPFPKIIKQADKIIHLAECMQLIAGKLSIPQLNISYLQHEVGRVLPDEPDSNKKAEASK